MIAVVLYHAGIPGIAGGYIGVDVFFVISGFLITGCSGARSATTNTVALGRFYGARARRLLPAAATVGVVTAIAAAVVLPPLQARSVFIDGIASALYVGNYRFAIQGTDYLTADLPSPFQHYWSLGVEEQFYLVWPVLIIGTAWLVRRVRRSAAARAAPYAVVLALVAAASLATAVLWTRTLAAVGVLLAAHPRLGARRRRPGGAVDPALAPAAAAARGDRRLGRPGSDPADLHPAGPAHPLPRHRGAAARAGHRAGDRRRLRHPAAWGSVACCAARRCERSAGCPTPGTYGIGRCCC